jgi:large subunit ribosomal protein L4
MVDAMKKLNVTEKALVVIPAKDTNVQKSARNIEGLKTTSVSSLNVYDLLNNKKLILTVDAVKKIEEVYA